MGTEHTLRLIGEFLTQGGHAHGVDPDTLHREAALVDAAPDLLAALTYVMPWLEAHIGQGLSAHELDNIRATIAKATGEI